LSANQRGSFFDDGPLAPWESLAEEFAEAGHALPAELCELSRITREGNEEEERPQSARPKPICLRHSTRIRERRSAFPAAARAVPRSRSGSSEGLAQTKVTDGRIRQVRQDEWPDCTSPLFEFDFLSTVSGGGYAGSWLSAWVARSGLPAVTAQLGQRARGTFDPESEPLLHLRRYAAFLNPRLGVLSADTWTLVATVIRNLPLNWLVILPVFMRVLLVPAIYRELTIITPGAGISTAALDTGLGLLALATAYVGNN
jgi:hypothetical protein